MADEKGSDGDAGTKYIEIMADMATGAGSAAIGLVDPILGVVGAGAAPALSHALNELGGVVRERLRRRLTVVAEAAEAASEMQIDELVARAQGDPAREEIAERVFRIASHPGPEAKMRALGRALASGALAESRGSLDETSLMLRAIEDLEAPHIMVLQKLYLEGDRYNGVPDIELAEMFPNGVQVMYAILKTLERHGLAGPLNTTVDEGPDSVAIWVIWDFGVLLMKQLFAVGDGSTSTR